MTSVESVPSTSTQVPAVGAAPDGPPQRKQLTKAERRELQEKQRAAKAAATAAGAPAKAGNAPKPAPKPSQSQNTKASTPAGASGSTATASNAPATAAKKAAKSGKETDTQLVDKTADLEAQRRHQTRIFTHFVGKKEGGLGTGIKGEIHPAIIRLGRQFADMKIVGANARCIAALVAFKTIIQDYITPQNLTLARDLTQYISPQISYLVSARPMAVGMGNSIRELKYHISVVSIDMPEQDAKDHLCEQIDTYISHRIVLADSVIEEYAMAKIQNGAVIMTYARSSVVERVLIAAWTRGKRFSVKVVDSRPMLEGKNMLAQFVKVGIPCTYLLINGVGSVIAEVSMVFLGAHAINSNGSVYSRAGTALVAMLAKEHSVPVLVLSETYKYSNNIQLDSFTKNELAPIPDPRTSSRRITTRDRLGNETDVDDETRNPNLQSINPLYDLTPHTHITVLVTEVGLIPPSAISTLAGLRDKDKGMQLSV